MSALLFVNKFVVVLKVYIQLLRNNVVGCMSFVRSGVLEFNNFMLYSNMHIYRFNNYPRFRNLLENQSKFS